MIITLYKAPLQPGCSTCWTNCPFVSFLFFCRITFFFFSSPASFLFMCVIYDVWCFMKRFSWFALFFLHSFSLSFSFTFTFTSTQTWAVAVEEQSIPITASCVCYGCHNRLITTAKRCVVWIREESLFFVSNSPHYRHLSCVHHQLLVFFFFFWWKQCWISHKYTTWVAARRLWSLKRW